MRLEPRTTLWLEGMRAIREVTKIIQNARPRKVKSIEYVDGVWRFQLLDLPTPYKVIVLPMWYSQPPDNLRVFFLVDYPETPAAPVAPAIAGADLTGAVNPRLAYDDSSPLLVQSSHH